MTSKKKLLVIDDEDDFRKTLKDRLEHEGYEVLEAASGQAGIDSARVSRPNLIILDLLMPQLSGYQVWTSLKRDEDLKDIPVIILSAKPQAQDTFWKNSMPLKDYFLKTDIFDSLIKRIYEKVSD